MTGRLTSGVGPGGLGGCLGHDPDCLARDIHKLVERGNRWHHLVMKTDFENYIDRHIKLLLENDHRGRNDFTEILGVYATHSPDDIAPPSGHAECPLEGHWKVRNLFSQFRDVEHFVICQWGQDAMLVGRVELVDHVKKAVPSRLTVRRKINHGAKEPVTDAVGQSILHGFLKPISGFGKGELNGPFRTFVVREGGDDLPVSMVQRGSDVVRRVPADDCGPIYRGFVSFGENGSLTGFGIGFDNITEGMAFAEQFVKLGDAFRSSIEF